MSHTLIVCGFTGDKRCYLDVTREEAIRRYTKSEGWAPFDVKEYDFDDEFWAYDAHGDV